MPDPTDENLALECRGALIRLQDYAAQLKERGCYVTLRLIDSDDGQQLTSTSLGDTLLELAIRQEREL